MKNIEQTTKMPVWRLMKNKTPENLIEELRNCATTSYENPEDADKARSELFAKLPKDMQNELLNFGVTLPTDAVELKLKLGSFLLDMYCCIEKAPTPPLARLVYQKKLMELAETFSKEDITLPSYAVAPILHMLTDDKEWAEAAIVTTIEVPSKTGKPEIKQVVLKSSAAGAFGNVVQAAAELMHEVSQLEAT